MEARRQFYGAGTCIWPTLGKLRFTNALRLTLLSFVGVFGTSCGGETEKRQLLELKKIAMETTLYPDFEKTGENDVLKRGMVYFNVYYRSNTKFSEIKAFYDRSLVEKGWGPPKQPGPSRFAGEAHSVRYRRGDYVLVVAEDEARSDNFAMVFIWDPQ